jgi:hypothetical protein
MGDAKEEYWCDTHGHWEQEFLDALGYPCGYFGEPKEIYQVVKTGYRAGRARGQEATQMLNSLASLELFKKQNREVEEVLREAVAWGRTGVHPDLK